MTKTTLPRKKKEKKCSMCNGTGMVKIGPNAKGIKKCPLYNGKSN